MSVGTTGPGVRHRDRRHAVSADDEGRAERARGRRRRGARPARRTGATIVPERADAVIESVSFGQGPHRRHVSEERLERRRGVRPDGQVAGRRGAAGHRRRRRRRRGRSHRGVPDVHELQLSDDDLPDRSGDTGRDAGAVGAAAGAGRSVAGRRRTGVVPVEGRHARSACSWCTRRAGARPATCRRCSTGYGGFNVNETPVFSRAAVPVVRSRRPVRAAESARRRRVRRRVARSRDARQEAERLRRLHRAPPSGSSRRATRSRRGSRSRADRTAACSPARRSRSVPICSARSSSPCRCSTCCATSTS